MHTEELELPVTKRLIDAHLAVQVNVDRMALMMQCRDSHYHKAYVAHLAENARRQLEHNIGAKTPDCAGCMHAQIDIMQMPMSTSTDSEAIRLIARCALRQCQRSVPYTISPMQSVADHMDLSPSPSRMVKHDPTTYIAPPPPPDPDRPLSSDDTAGAF